jgi:hypothetical protein
VARRFPEAGACIQRALKLDPGHADAQAQMTSYLVARGRIDEAEALLTLVEDHPEAAAFSRELRRFLREKRQVRTLFERKEFRDEALRPMLGVKWVQRFWSGWTVLWILAVAAGILLMFDSGNPLMVAPILGGVVSLWHFRKSLE